MGRKVYVLFYIKVRADSDVAIEMKRRFKKEVTVTILSCGGRVL